MARLLPLLVVVLLASLAHASITGTSCQGDAAMSITPSWDSGTSTLNISGLQYSYPAHLNGTFTTDTPTDPTVWIVESVANQTGFPWTGYHIDFGMTTPFSIVGVVAPPDWTWGITPPTAGQPLPADPSPGTGWVGSLNYYAGTPIGAGQSGTFGMVISFTGTSDFYAAQTPIPEPGSLVVLAIGALLLRRPHS